MTNINENMFAGPANQTDELWNVRLNAPITVAAWPAPSFNFLENRLKLNYLSYISNTLLIWSIKNVCGSGYKRNKSQYFPVIFIAV